MEQIEKTRNYDLFKYLLGNRSIKKGHLKKLKKAIEEDNKLNLHPIIVNKDFFIIDGQHRLECAKLLNLEIFYIKSENVNDLHLISCNVNQRRYEVENYIEYFSKKDRNPEYEKLNRMMLETNLKPKAILNLLIGIVSNELLEFLKTGKFKFPLQDESEKIINLYLDFMIYVRDKRITPLSTFTNHNFTRAFRWIYKTLGFEKEILFKKLDLRWFDLKPQRTAEDFYSLLISIYNYKNHNRLEEEYGKTSIS